jgi:hypothetical protein
MKLSCIIAYMVDAHIFYEYIFVPIAKNGKKP